MATSQHTDELIHWAEESKVQGPVSPDLPPWRVLIVDDDQDVHQATEFALKHQLIQGRALHFLNAHSAAEAQHLLRQEPDIAVVLLDVVMESEHAGLELVRTIREELGLEAVRIVLRTGQPGYAPEMEAIRDYDINDYKTKTELTRNRLYSVLTTAIRSYRQIQALNSQRAGLSQLAESSNRLLQQDTLEAFFQQTVTEAASLFASPLQAALCARASPPVNGEPPRLLAATPGLLAATDGSFSTLPGNVREPLQACLSQRSHQQKTDTLALYVRGPESAPLGLLVQAEQALTRDQLNLLHLFAAQVATCFENLTLLKRLRRSAFTDPLLDIPNRSSLIVSINEKARQDGLEGWVLALLDIDQFAVVNHVLGYRTGDQLLHAVARRLQQQFPAPALVARLGSDTFGLLGPKEHISLPTLQRCFRNAFNVNEQAHRLSASFGLVRLDGVAGQGEEALRSAHIALKRVQERDRGQGLYYHETMASEIRSRVSLVEELRKAMADNRLCLTYQPQLSLISGRPIGVEALIRWPGEHGDPIPPSVFIPLAEKAGLIIELGEWVLREACHAQRELAAAGHGDLRMGVNVSVKQFEHPDFIAMLDRVLSDTGIDPAHLELEITESVAALDPERLTQLLTNLKARGLSLAIDDFGTGFSSLSYLHRLPIDRLKVDRSFIQQLGQDGDRGEIARVVISLGKTLQLVLIAEGVERANQAEFLRELGCDEVQGFYFARPMKRAHLQHWLQEHPLGVSH
nr:EAL domain-containing protein [Motiliproteus sp. SC1-56]